MKVNTLFVAVFLLFLLEMGRCGVVQTSDKPLDEPHSPMQLPFPEDDFIYHLGLTSLLPSVWYFAFSVL